MAEYAANQLPVDEFRGREVIEWDSITECAEFHGVSLEQLKYLVHAGGCLDGFSMFDIPDDCPYDTRLVGKRLVEVYDTQTGKIISAAARRKSRRRTADADSRQRKVV